MMSEHGCRAWVLGQGQAATGTNTHSTSCGATESTSESAHVADWPQSHKTFLGPTLLGTFLLPLSGKAPLSEAPGEVSPDMHQPVCSRLRARTPGPRGTGWQSTCLGGNRWPPKPCPGHAGSFLGSRSQEKRSWPGGQAQGTQMQWSEPKEGTLGGHAWG